MDCLDRIGVRLAESALGPVRALRTQRPPAQATVTAADGTRRVHVVVRREGEDAYAWQIAEQPDRTGRAADPEEAYWAALDALL